MYRVYFNPIKRVKERNGGSTYISLNEIQYFNDFIDLSGLMDVLTIWRMFSWIKGDSSSMSIIDKFMLVID